MKKYQEFLNKYTTFKIGGKAEVFCIPTNIEELQSEIKSCREKNIPYHILGNGSNVLISDQGVKGYVFNLAHCCNNIQVEKNNIVKVGAGVNLHDFIKFSIKNGLYGNEYLSSVPGTIGGAVFMNAGTWIDKNLYISDYLTSVQYFDGEKIEEITKQDCQFSYRSSIFQKQPNWTIIEATFALPLQSTEIGEQKRKERLQWSMENQDIKYPNAGSIFRQGHGRAFNWLKGVRWGNAGWSSKTGNWINNYGGAPCKDVIRLIKIAQLFHFLILKKTDLEIIIWK